ncbi:hypothetical protein BaRGS_00016681 [Batillaria attramentaria]|uniref:Uncharacterized protein n=1 Tax=Batillaria attramentaria TaxID=370345 RepID=A0ABD0KXS8_9CAEN
MSNRRHSRRRQGDWQLWQNISEPYKRRKVACRSVSGWPPAQNPSRNPHLYFTSPLLLSLGTVVVARSFVHSLRKGEVRERGEWGEENWPATRINTAHKELPAHNFVPPKTECKHEFAARQLTGSVNGVGLRLSPWLPATGC